MLCMVNTVTWVTFDALRVFVEVRVPPYYCTAIPKGGVSIAPVQSQLFLDKGTFAAQCLRGLRYLVLVSQMGHSSCGTPAK